MAPLNREVLVLRHFEQLAPTETARELRIQKKGTRMRHVRALRRPKGIPDGLGGGRLEL
jgi:RNA polymerase sigma-70 factor (ECF subfamily)